MRLILGLTSKRYNYFIQQKINNINTDNNKEANSSNLQKNITNTNK